MFNFRQRFILIFGGLDSGLSKVQRGTTLTTLHLKTLHAPIKGLNKRQVFKIEKQLMRHFHLSERERLKETTLKIAAASKFQTIGSTPT